MRLQIMNKRSLAFNKFIDTLEKNRLVRKIVENAKKFSFNIAFVKKNIDLSFLNQIF